MLITKFTTSIQFLNRPGRREAALGTLAGCRPGAALENGDPKTTTKNHRGTRSQSVHYDLVVGQMFAKNSKQKLWLFVLYLFDPKFLKMAPGTHNVAAN